MAVPFKVDLVTPEKSVFQSDEAMMVSVRSIVGELAFMAGHIPYVGALMIAPARVTLMSGEVITIAVHGGLVHFRSDGTLVISSGVAELARDIDLNRARVAQESSIDPTSIDFKKASLRVQIAGGL